MEGKRKTNYSKISTKYYILIWITFEVYANCKYKGAISKLRLEWQHFRKGQRHAIIFQILTQIIWNLCSKYVDEDFLLFWILREHSDWNKQVLKLLNYIAIALYVPCCVTVLVKWWCHGSKPRNTNNETGNLGEKKTKQVIFHLLHSLMLKFTYVCMKQQEST